MSDFKQIFKLLFNQKVYKSFPFIILLSTSSILIIIIKLFHVQYNIFAELLFTIVILSGIRVFLEIIWQTVKSERQKSWMGIVLFLFYALLLYISQTLIDKSLIIPYLTFVLTVLTEKSCELFKNVILSND